MKNAIIVILTVALVGMTAVAYRNSTPLCDDLVRSQRYQFAGHKEYQDHGLVCELWLGDVAEDRANVRIR